MTVLSAIQGASLKIGVTRPTVIFASTVREHQELAELANDCARMIAYDSGHDWTRLKTLGTFTGDGATPAFDLPTDYQRMLKKARLWPSASPTSPYRHYTDTDEWLGDLVQGFVGVSGAWTIIGEDVHIRVGGSTSYLENTATAKFYYLTKYHSRNNSSVAIEAFTADTDVFKLDERLLKLAIIYRWKQDKGQDYAEHLSDYENALAEQIGNDKGSNILVLGTRRSPAGAEYAFPETIVP